MSWPGTQRSAYVFVPPTDPGVLALPAFYDESRLLLSADSGTRRYGNYPVRVENSAHASVTSWS